MSDDELVSLYLETQRGYYFDLLYNRYAGKVYGKCVSLLKNESDATDATQEIFVKILLKMSTFTGKSKFSTWIYSVTYNYCIDTIRKQKKGRHISSKPPEDIPDHEVEEVSDAEILEIQINQLKVVLDQINENDKIILLMKYQDGMSIQDIAAALSLSESAVKMRLKRAKHKFKLAHHETYKNAVL
ncbi:MAG: sigma-70 family RNA polymerase sigma factor [Saprospiraceae bacterium]|nr:sigma-70 family RNA polymerase sigma factor [Saprospiraceae bacterium]